MISRRSSLRYNTIGYSFSIGLMVVTRPTSWRFDLKIGGSNLPIISQLPQLTGPSWLRSPFKNDLDCRIISKKVKDKL